jgi:endogenous inhibitor of DNA gyrase (YacG/DUF329 family)
MAIIKKKCPSCAAETEYGVHAQFPFCSARCRDKDLLGWAQGERTLSTPITDADEAMDEIMRQSEGQF